MMSVFKEGFGEDLTNPLKYIPMKKITTFRDDIDRYAQSAIDLAKKKNNGIIDKNIFIGCGDLHILRGHPEGHLRT